MRWHTRWRRSNWSLVGPRVIAGLALVAVAGMNLYLAGAPTFTNDFWFHLKMGEIYASEGPWPDGDPMLHTAYPDAPVQHEWLFGILLHACERVIGFQGIRVVHVLAVAGILVMSFSIFRRVAGGTTLAAAATTAFAILTWTRLFQLRPDLVSILATLWLYDLLLRRGRRPGTREILLSIGLSFFWVNCHSLFALGPALLIAALLGCAMKIVLDAWALPAANRTAARRDSIEDARPVAVAMLAGLVVSLLNPRGYEQHLTFFSSSRDTAIWTVKDEWSHFDPFTIANNPGTVSPVLFWLMNGVMVAFVLASLVGIVAYVRRRPKARELFDPVLFGLGLASIVAIFVSVRFFWMAFFQLLFIAHMLGFALRSSSPRVQLGSKTSVAFAALILAISFASNTGYRQIAERMPNGLDAYFRTAYLSRKYHVEGVRFLRETGVEGNLFNSYPMGGFLGYWLAPELRTFIDSRTEHYPPEVLSDYTRINRLQDLQTGTSYLDILDQRKVDFFFGIGMPTDRFARTQGIYTTSHLAEVPGWVLVSRSFHHAIYLRDLPRNQQNFERIARYYREAGVPFDRKRGFSVRDTLKSNPEWAIAHEVLTRAQAARIGKIEEGAASRSAEALETLGLIFALTGEYEAMLETEAELAEVKPGSLASARRQVYGLIRLDEPERAVQEARRLAELVPDDLAARQWVEIALMYQRLSQSTAGSLRGLERRVLLDRFINPIVLISAFDAGLVERGLEGHPRVDGKQPGAR